MEKINHIEKQTKFLEKLETQINEYLEVYDSEGFEDYDIKSNPEVNEVRLFIRERLIKLTSYLYGLKLDPKSGNKGKDTKENGCQSSLEGQL